MTDLDNKIALLVDYIATARRMAMTITDDIWLALSDGRC